MSKTRNPDALIRIEDAIKVLCRETCHPGMLCPDNYCAEMWDEFNDVERVDAVPVVHGEWVWVQYDANPEIGNYHCSKCRFIPANFNMAKQHLKYCPECGAKMDGDGNG